MKLTIITINYNNLEGLKKTYESVSAQTFSDFEWIVIDGGSTDGSAKFIEEHKERFSYWCSEPDSGIYNAMNKGIVHATGDYINFMNSGDTYHTDDCLEKVMERISDCNIDVYYGNYYDIYEDGRKTSRVTPSALDYVFLMQYPINHQSTFINRQLLLTDLYDETYKLIADGKAFLKWNVAGRQFVHLDMYVADFYMGGAHERFLEITACERKRMVDEVVPESLQMVARKLIEERKTWEDYPTLRLARNICFRSVIARKVLTFTVKILTALFSVRDTK